MDVISHWYEHFQGLQMSTVDFYNAVDGAVRAKDIPGVQLSNIHHKEAGLLSGKRTYLRIERDDLYFEVCGAPFGNGFFVSARLISIETIRDVIAGNNFFLKATISPKTFYKIDTALMYQSLVHQALMEVVEEMLKRAGLPGLSEERKKPVMRGFYH